MAIFYNPNRKKGLFYMPSGATGGGAILRIEYSAARFCEDGTDPIPGITGDTGGTFSSTTGLVFISTSTGQVDLSASTPGTYVVTYTAPSSDTATTSITIDSIPVVSAGADVAICTGNSTVLTATGATTYSWSTGETTAIITVDPTTNTTYTVTGFNGACSATDSVDVTVHPLPTISISGTLTYCVGASTTLDAGAGFASYSWSSGETTQTISATAGNYTVTVTDSNGCSNTSAQVTVTELALPTVAISGTLSYCAGSNTTLTATAGLSSYLWSSGETTQSITATAGSYTVTGTDANGCSTTSSSVTVTETALDNAGFSYSASSYEPTDADPTPTITGLTGGTFSGTTGLVINSTTGEIDLSASTVATHTITYDTTSSGSSVCPNTSTQTVEIAVAGIANNYSMNFDGVNDYLQTGGVFSALDGLQKMTLSLWMKPISGAPLYEYVVTVPRNTTANEHVFSFQHFENNYLSFSIDGRTTKYALGDINAISYGQWNHVACVLDGTLSGADRMKIYINGADETTVTSIGTFTALQNASGGIIIGEEPQFAYNPYKGLLDELAIWNTALTSTQVAEIYNATSNNLTKDLSTVAGGPVYWNRMGD
jgi:hypothetical protein